MLKEILSVSGKPGLFKLISQGKNMFVVESLIDHKRIPVYTRETKVVPLGEISIYTNNEDLPLGKVLRQIKEKENGQAIDFNPKTVTSEELKSWFATVLPEFDRQRVHPSHIKKIMSWYNLLLSENLTDFAGDEEVQEVKENEEVKEEAKNENNSSENNS